MISVSKQRDSGLKNMEGKMKEEDRVMSLRAHSWALLNFPDAVAMLACV